MKYTIAEIKQTEKRPAPAIAVFVIDPIARKVVWFVANYTKITPNQVTILGFLMGLLSAIFLHKGYFIFGALFFEVYYIFDCVDGKLARLQGKTSPTGGMLDHILETALFFILTLSMISYLYSQHIHIISYIANIVFVFLLPFNKFLSYYSRCELGEYHSHSIIQSSASTGSTARKIKSRFSAKGIYCTISNTEAIHFAFFVGPLLLLMNPFYYILYGIIPANLALVVNVGLTLYRNMKLMRLTKRKMSQ